MNRRSSPAHVLITGASSGIGAALARSFSSDRAHLTLMGRDTARLKAVANDCRAAGAETTIAVADVTDKEAMRLAIESADRHHPLDCVIANAGISAGTDDGAESADQVTRIFAVNVHGVLNTVAPALDAMRRHGKGQVAIMSSLAGFFGFPGAPAYCASKAAVRVWGEGLRNDLARNGIGLTVICPGFVRSPMTDGNDFPMPFLMDADRASLIIRRGLARNRARIAFPLRMYTAVRLVAALPPSWRDRLIPDPPRKP
ncbi:MAG: SDR family NAD(P)-dependent oxidoreductase [Alphaproteobacteria bacterium]